jgi:hypothetical protein
MHTGEFSLILQHLASRSRSHMHTHRQAHTRTQRTRAHSRTHLLHIQHRGPGARFVTSDKVMRPLFEVRSATPVCFGFIFLCVVVLLLRRTLRDE